MKKIIIINLLILFVLVGLSTNTYANQDQFCAGYNEGYKAIKGNNAYVGYCPYGGYTPYGSTAYREGLKRGMAAASK